MKVTTDGCLFGAIVANEIRNEEVCQVLDIGAGTGLLSLMVAQENADAIVNAIELDALAVAQAKQNMEASPWSGRIQVTEADILLFTSPLPYNFIISNPPFYEYQLASPDAGRQMAHHSSGLTLQQLFQQVNRLLKEDGKFFVLLPFYRAEEATIMAKDYGFFVNKRWLIKQSPRHSFFRSILCVSRRGVSAASNFEITILYEDGNYSEGFSNLLRPFYLRIS